jgi:hypothetical protein
MAYTKPLPDDDDDFGFSAISANEYEGRIARAEADAASNIAKDYDVQIQEYKEKLQTIEAMILPFLEKLRDTGDKEYIFWPNRKPAINKQIDKLLKLTR